MAAGSNAEIVAEAARFQEFRDSDCTKACFDALEAHFTAQWRHSDKPEIAEALWHRVRAIQQVRQEIDSRIAAGVVAQDEIDRYERKGIDPGDRAKSRRKGK